MDSIVNKVKKQNNNTISAPIETVDNSKKKDILNYTPNMKLYEKKNKFEYLNEIKNKIEELDKEFHLKIFNIFVANNIEFSENRNGVFINLNNLSNGILTQINEILHYFNTQEQNLNDIENIKKEINNDFFNYKNIKKDNKNNGLYINTLQNDTSL
jgi:hypothetical protein